MRNRKIILKIALLHEKNRLSKKANQDFDLEADEKIDFSASNFMELFDKLNSYNI